MSATIESPYPEYPGNIVLPDGLTWPQMLAFDKALFATRGVATLESCVNSIAALNMIVEWHIDNLPEKPMPQDIFTGHPMKDAKFFYTWVFSKCAGVFNAERDVPKVSGSGLSDTPKTPAKTTGQKN